MNWVDYREKLGIDFLDNEKFKYLKQQVFNCLEISNAKSDFMDYFNFCNLTSSEINPGLLGDFGEDRFNHIKQIIKTNSDSIGDFFSYYIAFLNTRTDNPGDIWTTHTFFKSLEKSLYESHLQYEIIQKDNEYLVFPNGVKEFDDGLVSEPLSWLNDYPNAQKTYTNALKQYTDRIYIRDVADNFRKALEEFLQEFLKNDKNLDNNINEIGKYLKEKGAEKEITDILVKVIDLYKKLNDKIAKHNDKVDEKFLEFLMYQTGIFIRMLIIVKKSDTIENTPVAK